MTAQLAFSEKYKPAREQVLDLLGDLQWHSWKDLRRVGGVRYGARLGELKDDGYSIETRDSTLTDDGKDYRLRWLTPGEGRDPRVKVYLNPDDAALLMLGHVSEGAREAVKVAIESYQRRSVKF